MAELEQTALTTRRLTWAWLAVFTVTYAASLYTLNFGLPFDHALSELFITRPCTAKNYYSCWVFDKSNALYTFILHTAPNALFTFVAVVAALVFVAGFFKPRARPYRELSLMLVIGIGGVSGLVSLLKNVTGHYCPAQLAFFGGPVGDVPPPRPRAACYPAGHPSPGFGLMVLYFSALPLFWRRFGLYAGLGCGSLLGFIQIARGEHFLSHNIASALTAVFVGGIVWLINRHLETGLHEAAGSRRR